MGHLKTNLDHLPHSHQRELARVVEILHAEFLEATQNKTSTKKRAARILKIILFGSFAKSTWVDDAASGYKSDYDILVIVNDDWLTDYADYWYNAFDTIMTDTSIHREVNFIVHTLEDVNANLARGQYFFTDIKQEGVVLYQQSGGKPLVEANNPSPQEAYEISKEYFEDRFPQIEGALRLSAFAKQEGNERDAAFMLHQAVERAYACLQLVFTHYVPGTHNIKHLRSLAEQQDERLITAWPRDKDLPDARKHRAAYELLAEAYVKARYSKHFTITDEQLTWLTAQATTLQAQVRTACDDKLVQLRGHNT